MRVLKFISDDTASKCISDAFDHVIVIVKEPLPFDRIELHIRHGSTSLNNGIAKLFIDSSAGAFKECDDDIAEAAVRFELYRLFIKRVRIVPRMTEDVIVGREMIRKGFSGSLACMLHAVVVSQDVVDLNSYIMVNLPWIIFHGDDFHSGFFRSVADKKRNRQYNTAAKNLFSALQKDLNDERNLANAVKLEMRMHADSQI